MKKTRTPSISSESLESQTSEKSEASVRSQRSERSQSSVSERKSKRSSGPRKSALKRQKNASLRTKYCRTKSIDLLSALKFTFIGRQKVQVKRNGIPIRSLQDDVKELKGDPAMKIGRKILLLQINNKVKNQNLRPRLTSTIYFY